MKAQVATEFLVIVSVSLIILIPIIYFAFFYAFESTTSSEVQRTANNIADTADYIYSLGNGSQATIQVSIPQGVINSSVTNKTISFKIGNRAGISDVIAVTKANVVGTVPSSVGIYKIKLQNLNGLIIINW